MKTLFARLICLNAVILLTSGILFSATHVQPQSTSNYKKVHYSAKSELNVESLSFLEEEEEEDNFLEFNYLFDFECPSIFFKEKSINKPQFHPTSYQYSHTEKTPRWIKIRHIII